MSHAAARRIVQVGSMTAAVMLTLCGCGQGEQSRITGNALSSRPNPGSLSVKTGRQVFEANCRSCHGPEGIGSPSWKVLGPDGNYPPPPLDGSGHAWHHSTQVLRDFILDGSPPGQGNMPGWRGKLSDDEIEAVIAWMQSLWPDDRYEAWYRMEHAQAQ